MNWKEIPGRPGCFVSSCGQVRTGDYVHKQSNSNGYRHVRLSNPREIKKVHRLVALAFIPNIENHPIINHIDHNKANNDVSNLEWCTHKHNSQHMVKAGRDPKNSLGLRAKNAKISDETVRDIRRDHSLGVGGYRKLSEFYGIPRTTIQYIVKRLKYKYVD